MAGSVVIFATLLAAAASGEQTKTVTLTCPEGFHVLGLSCYLLTGAVPGAAAANACRAAGGVPAVVESKQEMDLLKDSFLNSTVHLGVNSDHYKADYLSILSKINGHAGYTNFMSGQPAGCAKQTCVVADAENDYAWKEANCAEPFPVLCKTVAAVSAHTSSCSCPHGALLHYATCFWVDSSRQYSWTDARRKCRSLGMQLASVQSQQEHDFLHGLASREALWIGLNDLATEDTFVWEDGTPVTYQNWHPNRPSGGDTENCVVMLHGGWYDDPCPQKLGVVCRAASK